MVYAYPVRRARGRDLEAGFRPTASGVVWEMGRAALAREHWQYQCDVTTMNDNIPAALWAVWERVCDLTATDPELRKRVRSFAESLLNLTGEAIKAPEPKLVDVAPPPREPLPPITFHLPRPVPPPAAVLPAYPPQPQVADADLPIIEARCRLKAETCRWAGERQRRQRAGADYAADLEPTDRPLITRAKALPDCFLWMLHREAALPGDLSRYDDLAGCFEAAADAAAVLQVVTLFPEDDEPFARAMELAAEAQSIVRVAVGMIDPGYVDNDQLKLFIWLREAASNRRTLIRRYMKRDDPADPSAWGDLRERIADLNRRLRRGRDREKRRKELFNQARYHLRRIHGDASGEHEHDWHKVVDAVNNLVDEGLPPSNVDLRDLVLPIADELPDELILPKGVELVLREIDRYLALRPAEDAVNGRGEAPPEDVRKARELLYGRSLVLIGGERRPSAAEALEEALGLRELIWIETREHQTHAVFEPYVARDDVACVVLAIRWSSHGFGEVKEFCDKYGKPLVRLPAGYSPNQVAYHLMRQVGDRLTNRPAAAG